MKYISCFQLLIIILFIFLFKIYVLAAVLIYDGDTPGFMLSDGVVHSDPVGSGSMTEAMIGNPGKGMRLAFIDINTWWQEHWWDLNNNKNIGLNTHLIFDVRAESGNVNKFIMRINWRQVYTDIVNYLVEGGSIDATWKTARIPLSNLLDTGQTQIDFLSFINNWNEDYIVNVDNIRLERLLLISDYDFMPALVSTGQKNVNAVKFKIKNAKSEARNSKS